MVKGKIERPGETSFASTTLAGNIDKTRDLQERLLAAKGVLDSGMEKLSQKETNLRETNSNLSVFLRELEYKNSIYNQPKEYVPADRAEELERLKRNVSIAEQELKGVTETCNSINKEINETEDKLKNFQYVALAEDVLKYQFDFIRVQKKVDDLQEAICIQEEVIKVDSIIPSMKEWNTKRENLLAEIASGQASENDLQEFEKVFSKEEKIIEAAQAKANKAIAFANQTISGLKRKLMVATNELNLMKSKKVDVLSHFFKAQLEAVAEEYVELAGKLVEKYKQILALEYLSTVCRGKLKILLLNWEALSIPLFNLNACKTLNSTYFPGLWDESRFASYSKSLKMSVEAEMGRIDKLGIVLPVTPAE